MRQRGPWLPVVAFILVSPVWVAWPYLRISAHVSHSSEVVRVLVRTEPIGEASLLAEAEAVAVARVRRISEPRYNSEDGMPWWPSERPAEGCLSAPFPYYVISLEVAAYWRDQLGLGDHLELWVVGSQPADESRQAAEVISEGAHVVVLVERGRWAWADGTWREVLVPSGALQGVYGLQSSGALVSASRHTGSALGRSKTLRDLRAAVDAEDVAVRVKQGAP